jgi:soluble lytic murein transglycosylase
VKRSAAPRTAKKKPAAAAPVQSASKAPAKSSSASANKSAEAQLEQWCRALKEKDPGAYEHLAALAQKKSAGELGQRAALALGYYDFTRAQYAAAAASLESATADPIVGEYALYWRAEAVRAQGDNARAAALFETFRSNYPTSVMSEQAVGSLAETELALGQPDKAIAALGPDSVVSARSQFLFLRAQAWEQAKQPEAAVRDYQAVVYRYPTSTESRESELKEKFLAKDLGARVPQVPVDLQQSRANQLYSAHNWLAALDAYTTLLPNLSGSDRDRVLLRQIQCRVAMGANSNELLSLKISDPDADAERLYNLSQSYRSHAQEPEMLDAVEQAARRAPQSGWTEQALFATGNYYWVALERSQAASYYSRVAASFPDANDADAAQWRVAWVAHLARTPDAAALLEAHLRRYPTSTFTPDALYWLGREAERAGDSPLARGYYVKLQMRYPRNYFQQLAQARLQSLGGSPRTDALVLAVIPAPPPVRPLGDSVPPSAAAQKARADALRTIAMDASAELELRAAYNATGEPRFLLEAAQEANNAGQYGAAIVAVRQICPQIESRRADELPGEVWRAAYPLPFGPELMRNAARAGVDPMLVAGLIRQESAFNPKAVSHAGADGLMQLLPKTARRMARQVHSGYSHSRLFDPDYNTRLGTTYLFSLEKSAGGVEAALAAYNAGEDRVALWQSGQNFQEVAELVESIPFTETREYVQMVMRNAEIYRTLYGGKQ